MAVNMGEAVGKVSLDVSGVEKGVAKVQNAFENMNNVSQKSVDSVTKYAESLETVLAGAYKEIAKNSTQVQAAQQAYATILESNQQKVQAYSESVAAAETKQHIVGQQLLSLQQALAQAEEIRNSQLQRYNDLKQKEGVNQRTLQANYEKLQRDLQIEENLRNEVLAAITKEQTATQELIDAKKQYSNVVNQAARSNAQAQANVAKVEEETARKILENTSKELEIINKVREGNKQSTDERKSQSREITQIIEKETQVTKELGDNQALAFAVAAKAVNEVVNALKRAVQETINLAKQIVTIGSDFETSMAQVAATSGMTAGDIKNNISDYADLVNAAKEAGLTTVFSASQAGEALNYLALAGYSVQESIETMPDILTIAAAGAMDLGRASDMVTDAMNALDLSIEDTSTFIDKMAKTAQSSNTNVEQLGNAILTVGGTATVLSGGVTELDTALGVLANSGIKARQGGTALRQILLNLTNPSEKASKKMEELGLQIYDTEGNMRALNEIFSDLNTIMADFSDKERMEALGTIFDARQIRSATALLQGSVGAWQELEDKINSAEGAAEKMAETMRSNLNGTVNIAKSNLDALATTIYEGVQKNITDLVTETIPRLQKLNSVLASPEMQSRLENMSKQIKEIALKLLDIAIDAAPKILTAISNVEANLRALGVAISTIIALKAAIHFKEMTAAVEAFNAVLATNPYLIVIAAIGTYISLIIQLKGEYEQTKQAMVAAIEDENDAYAEQRNTIQGVVDEWNSYKEASQQVMDDAKSHQNKVKALYDEYVSLKNAGEDTTLAMEALANEVPELKSMLGEGEVSFEDITSAVDNYCNSLIRAAQLQSSKDDYTQAVQTRDALKEQLDTAKQAMIESGEAWEQAKQNTKDFVAEHGKDIRKWSQEEVWAYDRLKATQEALSNIYGNNIVTYNNASEAYKEADQQVIDSRDAFNEAIKEDMIAEGKIYADRDKAAAAEAEKRAKQSAAQQEENAQKRIEQQQTEVDELLDYWDSLDKQISARAMTEDEKWSIVGDWFKANPDWDKDNEDLLKQYDKYMTYIEKGEEELRKQQESDAKKRQQEEEERQKEREQNLKKQVSRDLTAIDDAATAGDLVGEEYIKSLEEHRDKYASYYAQDQDEKAKIDRKIAQADKKYQEQKLKDDEAARKKLVQDDLSSIEHQKKIYNWSEEEYNNALKEHLKTFNDYYNDYIDERQKIQWKVEESEADIERKNAENAKKESEAYFKTWTSGYEDLLNEATKAYGELEKERTKFQDNLLKSVELYGTKTEKVWDKATHKYKDVSVTGITSTKELKEQLKDIQDFDKTMQSLKNKGISEDLLSEIWGMDTDKAMEFANALSKMSSGELKAYSDAYQGIVDQTAKMSDEYYQGRINDFEEKYITPLSKYVEEHAEELQANMGNIGEDTINGWIAGMEQKSAESEGAVKGIFDQSITTAKKALGIASPSKEFFSIGEFTMQGFLNGIQSKIENFTNIFTTLGQRAGESFVTAFQTTWDNFINMLNGTGGLAIPATMTTSMFGSPVNNGSQVVYSNTSSYSGLTKADVISAIKEAVPDGDIILTVNETQFGRISRNALNLLAQQQGTLGLQV